MEVDIDPLQVLEQIIMTNEENPNNGEVPEEEFLESINSLAVQLSEPGTSNVEGPSNDSGGPSTRSEVPVDQLDPAESSSPTTNAPYDINNGQTANTHPIDPLPSAPDFSFMDLLSAPTDNPFLVLNTPPVIAFNQNNIFEEVKMREPPKRGGNKRQNSRKVNSNSKADEERRKLELSQRTKLMANINQLASVSQREQAYRHKLFPDEVMVRKKQIDCTICGAHIGCRIGMSVICVTHPLLKVLVCCRCKSSYMLADWKLGAEGKDMKCRWCSKQPTKASMLKNCSQCPFAFCQSCISRNFSNAEWELTIAKAFWTCYACQMIPFYLSRAICWALGRYVNTLALKKEEVSPYIDLSTCCSLKKDVNKERNPPARVPQVTQGTNGAAVPQMQFDWVRKRLNAYFSQVHGVQNQMLAIMRKQVMTYQEKVSAVQEIIEALTNLSGVSSSTSSAVHNWLRLQEPVDSMPVTQPVTVLSSVLRGSSNAKRPAQKRQAPPIKRQPPKRNKPQPQPRLDYDELVKKFNIKQCYVLLERYNFEEAEQPDLTHLLFPKVELRVDVDESTNNECIVLD